MEGGTKADILNALQEKREKVHKFEMDLIRMLSINPHEKAGPALEANSAPSVMVLDAQINKLIKEIYG